MIAFGPYVVEAELGRGAAGVVFRARDPKDPNGAVVAVKVLLQRPGEASGEGRAARRMEREVRVLERLRHPSIVAVRATGEARGALWVAMDFVDGRTLQQRLDREGPLPTREAASILLELAHAVSYAHGEGVLHRDLKPANVLLDRAGRPLLADFGLAKDLAGTLHGQSLSTSGQFMGTPGYWPPEQARGEHGNIGRASDVYGLGALLYAMLTGEPPSGHAESLVQALAAAEREPPPPSRLRPEVPAALDAICARCLRRSPAERYDSAADVAAALQAWLVVRRARGHGRRSRRVVPLAAGSVVLVLAVAGVLASRPGDAPSTATDRDVAAVTTTVSPAGRAAEEIARLMAAGDSEAALAFIDRLPPELQKVEQIALSRALTCLELGLRGVTGDARAEGEAHLERAVELGRDATDPDVQLAGARALSALGRHDEAIAAFKPLLASPGDLGAPLFHGARMAGERAFPAATASFFSRRQPDPSFHAGQHFNLIVDLKVNDVLPEDRAGAFVCLARALHDTGIFVAPDPIETAIELAPDDPNVLLARAERSLAKRGEPDLVGAEADLKKVRAQEATLTPDARARLALLSGLLQMERLFAQGQSAQAAGQAHLYLRAATGRDAWTVAGVEHLRARRAQALGLPPPAEDRPLTDEELDRLTGLARQLTDRNRVELFLDVADALPARAREQVPVISLRASMHLERAGKLTHEAKADEARAEYEHALALLTPPRETMARVMRGDALSGLQRWIDAVAEFERAVREAPGFVPQVRENALAAAFGAFPSSVWACFLRPGQRPPSATKAVAFLRSLLPTEERASAERVKIIVAIARACHAQGDAVGAEGMLRLAAEESPREATLLFARAEWHAAAGRLEEARADLDAMPGNDKYKVLLRTVIEVEARITSGRAAEGRKIIDDALPGIDPQGNVWMIEVVNHLRGQRARAVQAGGGDGGG